jgi:hypothetical protein
MLLLSILILCSAGVFWCPAFSCSAFPTSHLRASLPTTPLLHVAAPPPLPSLARFRLSLAQASRYSGLSTLFACSVSPPFLSPGLVGILAVSSLRLLCLAAFPTPLSSSTRRQLLPFPCLPVTPPFIQQRERLHPSWLPPSLST